MSNTHSKTCDTALAEFKAAEKDTARFTTMVDEASRRLLEAKMAASTIDTEAQTFGANGKGDDIAAMNDLVARQTRANNVVPLLERSLDHLVSQLAAAKARVIIAEHACRRAQRDFYCAEIDSLVTEFLKTHRAILQRMVVANYWASLLTRADTLGMGAARMGAYTSLEKLFEFTFADAAREIDADPSFCKDTPAKGQSSTEVIQSELITADERGQALNPMGGERNATDLAAALMPKAIDTTITGQLKQAA